MSRGRLFIEFPSFKLDTRKIRQRTLVSVTLNRDKPVYSALWVQVTLVVCYLPSGIIVALQPQRGKSLSIHHDLEFTATLVYLNSSLNPFLYCWKIREVRQAVKETLKQLFCRSS